MSEGRGTGRPARTQATRRRVRARRQEGVNVCVGRARQAPRWTSELAGEGVDASASAHFSQRFANQAAAGAAAAETVKEVVVAMAVLLRFG
jgi:hypothetical protein